MRPHTDSKALEVFTGFAITLFFAWLIVRAF